MEASEAIEHARRYCRAVTRRRAGNFYYGLKLLPEPQRSALYAVYAWMRRADDLADEVDGDVDAARAALVRLKRQTDEALAGQPPIHDPVLVGLQQTSQRFNLSPACFHDLIEGQLDDLCGRSYGTFDDLREYCYRVASTVGLICVEIWGYRDERVPQLAVGRGIAFQLTNILRDFVEDYDAGRVYLPAEDFARHDLRPDELRQWCDEARCRAFLGEQIERAGSFYERSQALDALVDPECLPTLWAMTTIYRRLLEKMRLEPAQIVLGSRIRLSAVSKGAIALRARWQARPGRAATR